MYGFGSELLFFAVVFKIGSASEHALISYGAFVFLQVWADIFRRHRIFNGRAVLSGKFKLKNTGVQSVI